MTEEKINPPTEGSKSNVAYLKQVEAKPFPVGKEALEVSRPPSSERKRINKRINEQLKIFASGMNTLAGAVLGTSILIPLITAPEKFIENYSPIWFLVGVALHIIGLVVFGLNYQSEE